MGKLSEYNTTITLQQHVGKTFPSGTQKVEFSIDVIVDEDGSPRLLLETGTEDSAATFYTGNGTSVLTFRSTVQVCFLRVAATTAVTASRNTPPRMYAMCYQRV